MRAVVANAFLCVVVCTAACELTPSPVGKSCGDDSACKDTAGDPSAGVHHCELALPSPTCLPGPASVAAPKNRAPFGKSTTIVALTGTTTAGTIGVVDPEGATTTLVDDNGAALDENSVVQVNGGTALLTITDARTGAFDFVAGGEAFVDVALLHVSDGVNPASSATIPIAVAVVDASSSSVSKGGEWSDGASWSTGAAPIATSTALVDGHVHIGGPAAQASELLGTARAALQIDPDGVLLGGTAPVWFFSGTAAGDGQVAIGAAARVAGSAPAVGLVLGASIAAAFSARSITHASGGELLVEEGASLIVDDDAGAGTADLPTLTLASGAVVEVRGPLALQELNISSAAAGDRERTVVVHADASMAAIRPGSWRLIADGVAGKLQSLRVNGALDAVEIRPAADVSFAGVTRMNDVLLEGGMAVDKDVVVDTLHIRRIPRAMAGSRTIHADVCDVPNDIDDVPLPSYIVCASKN